MKPSQQQIDAAVAAILSPHAVGGTVRLPGSMSVPQKALSHAEQNAAWVQIYQQDFPHLITATIEALMDNQAQEWLITNVGAVGVDWRIVTDYPTDDLDTYLFRDPQHALWFKLSFS